MDSLSSRQRAFIELMKDGEDYERRGFELLLQRPDFPDFFDALAEEGLFAPSRNSGPVEADKPGHYRVPVLAAAHLSRSRRPRRRKSGRRGSRRKGHASRPQR